VPSKKAAMIDRLSLASHKPFLTARVAEELLKAFLKKVHLRSLSATYQIPVNSD
jgi:hypothetical protein